VLVDEVGREVDSGMHGERGHPDEVVDLALIELAAVRGKA